MLTQGQWLSFPLAVALGVGANKLDKDACNFFGRVGVYEDHGGIVLSAEEGKAIAKALGKGNIACILQNHGWVDFRRCFFCMRLVLSG